MIHFSDIDFKIIQAEVIQIGNFIQIYFTFPLVCIPNQYSVIRLDVSMIMKKRYLLIRVINLTKAQFLVEFVRYTHQYLNQVYDKTIIQNF